MEGFFLTMRYTRLTKEQFEDLHDEFAKFLATQGVDKPKWDAIKAQQPDVAEQVLDVFSDIIWEGVLSKIDYLENNSPQQLFLFQLGETEMKAMVIKTDENVDFTTQEGLQWLEREFHSDVVELLTATKEYVNGRNLDIFTLIQQGAVITEGELFQAIEKVLS